MRRRNTDNRDSIDTILGLTAFIADVFSKRNKTPEITPPSPVEPKKEVKPREQKPPAQPVRPVQTPIQSAITNGLALSQLTMPPMPMYYYMPAQQIQMPYGFIPQVQYPVVKPMVQQRKQGPLRRCATHIAISHYILAQMRKQKIEAN